MRVLQEVFFPDSGNKNSFWVPQKGTRGLHSRIPSGAPLKISSGDPSEILVGDDFSLEMVWELLQDCFFFFNFFIKSSKNSTRNSSSFSLSFFDMSPGVSRGIPSGIPPSVLFFRNSFVNSSRSSYLHFTRSWLLNSLKESQRIPPGVLSDVFSEVPSKTPTRVLSILIFF